MSYVNCLHCERPLQGRQKFCNQLCKSAEFKRLRKHRAAEDAHWATIESRPTFDLTDVECFQLEAAVASQEQHVFDGNGFRITDAKDETNYAATDGLRESWADKGAELDVWEIRRKDRERFGGIVMTPELAAEFSLTLWNLCLDQYYPPIDGLDSPGFHLKTFGFEIDELYELETGERA